MKADEIIETLDTRGTGLSFRPLSPEVVAEGRWHTFFKAEGLIHLDDFFNLSGKVVDRNRRSVVHHLKLGTEDHSFFLKLHTGFLKRSLSFPFRKEPVMFRELSNMMHYARAGFTALKPAAFGISGERAFIMVPALEGFIPLDLLLESAATGSVPVDKRKISEALAQMVARMHDQGLAHVDLFSWHVFVKICPDGEMVLQPIDFETTRRRGQSILSRLQFRRRMIDDLTALNLTIPLTLATTTDRLRFLKAYLALCPLLGDTKAVVHQVMKGSAHRGRKKKFKRFGVADKILQHL